MTADLPFIVTAEPDQPDRVELLCAKCGGQLPLPSEDELKLLLRTGARPTHATCPDEAPPPPAGRRFMVEVSIVELRGELEDDPVEMAAFTAEVREADLEAAMRPLALALGEKWLHVEANARIADDLA